MTDKWENILEQTPNGLEFDVKVKPAARTSRIVGLLGSALKVAVAAPPQRGKANDQLIKTLAKHLDLPPWQVQIQILRGQRSQTKRIRITGLARAELIKKLQQLLDTQKKAT